MLVAEGVEGADCAKIATTQQPLLTYIYQYYPVVAGRDLIGSEVRRSSREVVE